MIEPISLSRQLASSQSLPSQRRNAGGAIAALAVCAFVIGTTEFAVPGVLPEIATGLHVSITTAGLLVSGYALGVVVGAPFVTGVVVHFQRKQALVGLLVFSVAGNLVSALAGNYAMLMVGRAVASLCHGAFFGVASVVAAGLVVPERRARAVAGMFLGITVANLVGVPAGAWVGQHMGWRATFLAITVTGVAALVAVLAFVPSTGGQDRTTLRSELRPFRRLQVWLALGMTAFGFGAVYAPLTYVVPLMTTGAGFARAEVTWLLALFGAGMVVGNLIGARAADFNMMRTLVLALAGLVLVMVVFSAALHDKATAATALFILGGFAYATVPGFTMRVINSASSSGNTLASAAAVAAFNLGNAGGAYLGGLAIETTGHLSSTGFIGAAMAATGLALALALVGLDKRPLVPTETVRTGTDAAPLASPVGASAGDVLYDKTQGPNGLPGAGRTTNIGKSNGP